MLRLLTLLLSLWLSVSYAYAEDLEEHVVLLHGLGRTSYAMSPIAKELEKQGYETHNLYYASTRDPLAVHIRELLKDERRLWERDDVLLHFVCHSLGCLVTRGMIHQNRPPHLGRVVMLGPPNQGSEYADFLKDHRVMQWIFGATLPQLGTTNRHALEKLIGDDVDYETGVLAGNDWNDPLGNAIIPGSNDGKVAIEHTKIPGMTAHRILDATHTSLLTDEAAIVEIISFLKDGKFTDDPNSPDPAASRSSGAVFVP